MNSVMPLESSRKLLLPSVVLQRMRIIAYPAAAMLLSLSSIAFATNETSLTEKDARFVSIGLHVFCLRIPLTEQHPNQNAEAIKYRNGDYYKMYVEGDKYWLVATLEIYKEHLQIEGKQLQRSLQEGLQMIDEEKQLNKHVVVDEREEKDNLVLHEEWNEGVEEEDEEVKAIWEKVRAEIGGYVVQEFNSGSRAKVEYIKRELKRRETDDSFKGWIRKTGLLVRGKGGIVIHLKDPSPLRDSSSLSDKQRLEYIEKVNASNHMHAFEFSKLGKASKAFLRKARHFVARYSHTSGKLEFQKLGFRVYYNLIYL